MGVAEGERALADPPRVLAGDVCASLAPGCVREEWTGQAKCVHAWLQIVLDTTDGERKGVRLMFVNRAGKICVQLPPLLRRTHCARRAGNRAAPGKATHGISTSPTW